jgi:hypothetical protein
MLLRQAIQTRTFLVERRSSISQISHEKHADAANQSRTTRPINKQNDAMMMPKVVTLSCSVVVIVVIVAIVKLSCLFVEPFSLAAPALRTGVIDRSV